MKFIKFKKKKTKNRETQLEKRKKKVKKYVKKQFEIKCFKYGGKGHIAIKCPLRKGQEDYVSSID